MSSPGTVYIDICQFSAAIQCWHQIGLCLYSGGSNLSQDICYPGWGLHGFPQSHQENARIVPRLCQDCFLHNIFQYIIHQLFYQLTLYRLDTGSAIKQPTHNLALAQSSDLGWYQKQRCLMTGLPAAAKQLYILPLFTSHASLIKSTSNIATRKFRSTAKWHGNWVQDDNFMGGDTEILITSKMSVSFWAFVSKVLWTVPHKYGTPGISHSYHCIYWSPYYTQIKI